MGESYNTKVTKLAQHSNVIIIMIVICDIFSGLFFNQVHPLALSQSRSQFSCSVCDRSFPLLSSLLTHQLTHTEEQRLLAEAEAEIVCPPSLSLSLPLSSSSSAKREGEEGEREIHVSLIAVTEEGKKQAVKPTSRASGKAGRRGGGCKGSAANNGELY